MTTKTDNAREPSCYGSNPNGQARAENGCDVCMFESCCQEESYIRYNSTPSPPQPKYHLQKVGFTCERTQERHTFNSMTDFIIAFLTVKKERDEAMKREQPVDSSDVVKTIRHALRVACVESDSTTTIEQTYVPAIKALDSIPAMQPCAGMGETAYPPCDWHEDMGPVLWWRAPIEEPPYCGTPLDHCFTEDYYTHFSKLVVPKITAMKG